MELITIRENGINMVFGKADGKIRLLHLAAHEFDEATADTKSFEHYRLFEAQITGKNQLVHRGGKNICTSEGMAAKFSDFIDRKNEFGREIEVVQRTDSVEVVSHYQFYDGIAAVKSFTEITCVSDSPINLEHISAFCLYGLCKESGERNYDDLALWTADNSWYCEGQWKRRPLSDYGVLRVNGMHSMARALVSNTGSWSTKEYLPMGAAENLSSGEIMLWQIESGGSWNMEISACHNELYVNLFGPSGAENQWYKRLSRGEKFVTDEAVVAFGAGNIDSAVGQMIAYRRRVRRDYSDYKSLPVVYNPYMHDAWDYPYADRIEEAARGAAAMGADVFCIDAGWHDDEKDFFRVMGGWRESRDRFPEGLKKSLDYIRSLGLKAGLWLEIETVGMDSPVRAALGKECFFVRGGETPIVNNRLQLDFSVPRVRAHADEVIDRLMRDYAPDYIKMDYNQDSGPGSERGSVSAGEGLLRHVRAYREWIRGVMDRYPGLIIEACGSGGLRLDYYHLADHCICSTSDETDYRKYPYIAANIVTAGTPEQMGVWCYPLAGGDDEEVIFNVVSSALLRMQLSGDAYRLSGSRAALLCEGIAYHRAINAEKINALPFWPLGFSSFGGDFAAFGLRTDKKAWLAVWNMGAGGERVVPLGGEKVKDLRVGYPLGANTDFRLDGDKLVVRFDAPYRARIFEWTRT